MTRPRSDHTPAIISKARAAQLAGVAKSTITRACARGGALHDATVADRIDAAHPAFRGWLARHQAANGYTDVAALDPNRFITLDEFAARAGVTLEELQAELDANPALRAAVVQPVDADHPAARAWLDAEEPAS